MPCRWDESLLRCGLLSVQVATTCQWQLERWWRSSSPLQVNFSINKHTADAPCKLSSFLSMLLLNSSHSCKGCQNQSRAIPGGQGRLVSSLGSLAWRDCTKKWAMPRRSSPRAGEEAHCMLPFFTCQLLLVGNNRKQLSFKVCNGLGHT
jgi:hypothetical protein